MSLGHLKSRLQAGHFLCFSPFGSSDLVRPPSSLTPVFSVKAPHWHFHLERTWPMVKLDSSSLSDSQSPREAEQQFTWAVSVMDPGHGYCKFWMFHSGVQAHQSTSRRCRVGGRGRCMCGLVGIVKNTRRLFPY